MTVFFVRYEKVGPFSSPLQALALSRVKYLDIPVVLTATLIYGVVNHKKNIIFTCFLAAISVKRAIRLFILIITYICGPKEEQ